MAVSPAWICSKMSSSFAPPVMARASPARLAWRCQCSRARPPWGGLLVGGHHEVVTGAGPPSDSPSTCTGVDGPASLTCLPLVVDEGPDAAPGGTGHQRIADLAGCPAGPGRWPRGHGRCRGWPRARRPRPDRRVGRGGPRARRPPGGCSSSSSMPMLCRAEISHHDRCRRPTTRAAGRARPAGCITRFGSALSRSILLMATTIGTSAARAWLSASSVWGITPSSAATTRTTMSVASAPRARMAVNASWPGVSMKVMGRLVLDRPGRRRCAG